MVKNRFIPLLAALALFPASALQAKDYNIGDKADADVVSPVALVVVDSDATGALKEKEARRVPVVYRYYPQAIDEVDTAFASTLAKTRTSFLEAVRTAFHDGNLTEDELATPQFRRVVSSFQRQNLLFPVGTNLARIWAAGESDEDTVSPLIKQLREAMKSLVRSDVSPDDIWVGSTIRLISLAENESLTERVVAERGSSVYKTNFVSLPRAKSEFQALFSPEEHTVAAYAASFIKANCVMEVDFTRALRAKRMEGLLAADRYQPGQAIVRQGQVIDKKIKAALDQLNAELAKAAPQPQPQPQVAAIAPVKEKPERDWTLWLVGTLTAGFFALLAIVWTLVRRRTPVSLLPATIPGGPMDPASTGGPADGSWQQRALLAEQRVQQAQTMARAGLIAHLSQWLSDKMTRKLISQRAELLDAHQKAAVEMAELEARLHKIQAPLQERLRTYERRIAELEKELLVKGEENRELIKAKIQLVRKQLAIEREKNRLEFN
jgi:hypothetical protein